MLRNLGLDLDLSKVGKDVKLQLALPNKTIKKNITNVTQASLDGVEINGLPKLTFEIPHKIQKRVGTTDEIETVDNPDIKMIKEKMLIKVTWYNKKRVNWFRVTTITQTDSQDFVNMRVEADALQSELRATNVTTSEEPTNAIEYFTHVLSQTTWKLGYVSDKVKDTYRSFDDNKKTRYEAINNGLETFGAIAEWDEENRILNILSISDIREFRGVVLKKENYVSSLEIESNADDIVTRLYVYGNEKKGIEKVNPTGMAYIEDFSYFMFPFERDANKNVISHSDYMSDALCHAILDLKVLQDEYNPRIKDLQDKLNKAYGDLSKANMQLVELEGQLVTLEALLDTAKATNDLPLVATREKEVQAKEIEIFEKKEEIKSIQDSIEVWEKTIVSYQELISTTSFTQELQNELSLFIYEQEFSDDRYIEEDELYKAGKEQFDKYQRPVRTFNIQLASFVNSIESQHISDRLQIGEEVLVKSTKLKTEYKSIVLGYSVDFMTGDYNLIISDNMDDINSLDKLATLIYKADSSSTILNNNKYKWDNVTSIKSEVEAWREKEIKAVENRIVAGANESVVIDNRGIQAHNPDFPNERIIVQSGVVALSRDGGKTWSTSITPYGVNAETIIGKIIAGENLLITNDNGTFVIDNKGLTINMDDIHIMSGQSGTQEDMVQLWNNLLLTYNEIASDNLVNEYEKNQLDKQFVKITNIHSSMLEQFLRGWEELDTESGKVNPKPIEYNEYIKAYEDLNKYLNEEKQKDGFALLDPANRKETTEIDPVVFTEKFAEYEKKKASFESIISMSFTKASIDILEEGISLNYTRNNEIVTRLNLSEEGIRIDGKLLEINAETRFKKDLVMDAGVIRDKDNGIIIDLNKGEITLNKPIHIGADSNLVSKEDLDKLDLEAHTFVLTNDSAVIPTDKNGMNGDYSTATSSAFIYKGTKDVTDKWKITTSVSGGITGELVGNTYSVKNLTKDSGIVTFKATLGTATLTKTFNVTKAKAGLDGSEGKVRLLSLNADSYIMTFTNDLPKPEKQTVNVTADLVGIDKTVVWKVVPVFGGKELLPLVKVPTNNVIEITEEDLTGNIDLIKITVTVDDLSDTVSIVKVKNGDGIKNTRVEYQIGDSGTAQPTSVWSIVLPQPVKGKYLWTRTTTVYTDDTKIETFSVSYYALDGQVGEDGVGIEKTVIEYQTGSSGTTTPTGTWTTTIPTVDKGSYLWTRTTITYTNKTTSISYSTSYSPKDGEKGQDSITGFLTNESISLSADVGGLVSDYKNANGIFEVYDGITKKTGTSVKYSVASQDNITVTIDANGKYVASGFVTGKDKLTASATLRAVYGGVTLDKQLTLSKAFTGATGSSASSYWVTPTVNVLATTPTGRINPEAIGFNAYTKSGTSNATVYNGRFIIETSIDGKAYTVRYTSTKDEPNCVYTVDTKAKFVRVKLYQAGATTYLLDEQTIPVLDIDGDLYQAWCNDLNGYKDFTRVYPKPDGNNESLYMKYTGYSTKDSDNPSDYKWLSNADALGMYLAYSNSADGSLDFTRNSGGKIRLNFASETSDKWKTVNLGKEFTDVKIISKDEKGNVLKEKTENYEVGTTQTFTAETISGYNLADDKTKVVKITSGMTVEFKYEKIVVMTEVTINSIDEENKIIDTYKESYEVGEMNTFVAKNITGYELNDERTKSLKVTTNMVVQFKYKKVINLVQVPIEYINYDNGEVIERVVEPSELNKSKTFTAKTISGYNNYGDTTQTVTVLSNTVIRFYYKKLYQMTTVTIEHINSSTGALIERETRTHEIGSTQTYFSKAYTDYDIDGDLTQRKVVTAYMYVTFRYKPKPKNNNMLIDKGTISTVLKGGYDTREYWEYTAGGLSKINALAGDQITVSFLVSEKSNFSTYFMFQTGGASLTSWISTGDLIKGNRFSINFEYKSTYKNLTNDNMFKIMWGGGSAGDVIELSQPIMINSSIRRNAPMFRSVRMMSPRVLASVLSINNDTAKKISDVDITTNQELSGKSVVISAEIKARNNTKMIIEKIDKSNNKTYEESSTQIREGFLEIKTAIGVNVNKVVIYLETLVATQIDTVSYRHTQLEIGTERTDWKSNEIVEKTYLYTGFSTKDSDDYKDYKWSLTSQKVKTYKAWADAEDGTLNFTRVSPNENLLLKGRIINPASDDGSKYPIKNETMSEEGYDFVRTSRANPTLNPNTFSLYNTILPANINNYENLFGQTVTISGEFRASREVPMRLMARYGNFDTGENDFLKDDNTVVNVGTDWRRISITVPNFPKFKGFLRYMPYQPIVNDIDPNTFFLDSRDYKIEIGNETIYTTPPTESLIDSIMKFTGISVIDSDNPVDYEWVYSAEFAQAISQVGINEAQKIAEDVKNTADNAVQNEEFYSWLEQDYENQQKELKDISQKNQEDLTKMEGRTTAIEQTLGENKIKWTFIDNSFDFSDEGMFISNSNSRMRIQISSDKIVFWDNNVDVATITGEQLTIKRGLFLDSATIGNHVITKYSDTSSVTIIRYIGKV